MARRLAPITLLTLFSMAVCISPAAAETFVANPAAADGAAGSLRQRVVAAAAGDVVQLPPGTYRLTQGQPISVGPGVTLQGLGQRAAQVVITAEGRSRVLSVPAATNTVTLQMLQVSGGRVAGGAGGGILKQGAGALVLEDVTVSGNTTSGSQGGGGLAIFAGNVTVRRSTVAGNSATVSAANSGGGGILHAGLGTLALENASLAGNTATVSGAGAGGSAILATTGTLTLDSVTIAYNTTSPSGLGALRSAAVTPPTLINTMVSNNGGNCVGAFNSNGSNIDGDNSCDLDAAGDQPGIIPGIEQLGDNGGPTPTLRLPPGSLAINTGTCTQGEDQRGAARPAENETSCDVGAVEFEGWAEVQVPPCTRTGQLPFSIFSPRETGVEALDYTVDGGDPLNPLRVPIAGGPNSATGTLSIPQEGRRRLEYWADSFPTGTDRGVQLKHATPLVVVDRTDPRVQISNPNDFRVFVIKRRTNVNVSATDSISGLVLDPSGRRPLDTSRRGQKVFAAGAVDQCTNTATAPFSYRVLAPALGVRAVLERVRGRVVVDPAGGGSGARASQKGRSFTPLREPRELRIRSLVDTRKGTARLTSSRDSRTGIQDGEFVGGVFQVLQSRSRRSKGLTELRLKGSSFRRCRSRSGKASAAARRRVIRRLRGNARGRFRTRGRYSAATVRGTIWTVEDRCDGTLTKVRRGRVAVRDFRKRRTVVVRAGRSYLARAP